MIKDFKKLESTIVNQAREYGAECKKIFVCLSGGVDSSLITVILCKAFGSENVYALYRDIRSNPVHLEHAKDLQKKFGFKLWDIDANPMYDYFIDWVCEKFQDDDDFIWAEEGTVAAEALGLTDAFASLKSRFAVPMAGFISKAIDYGNGRIFGTGNGEEDELLRYFDKFGDGAVDNNLLKALNKAEVRQLALYLSVPERIVFKPPSADLESNGDKHNDEVQLTAWAKSMGYDIEISYGSSDGSIEGNVAEAWRYDLKYEIISDESCNISKQELIDDFDIEPDIAETILFLRELKDKTQHKVEPIPGTDRKDFVQRGILK